MKIPDISNRALDDLTGIWEYIAVDSPNQADRLVEVIYKRCQMIADHPKIGRERDSLHRGLRSFPVGNYVVFYEIRRDEVVIVRILHGAQDTDSIMRQ